MEYMRQTSLNNPHLKICNKLIIATALRRWKCLKHARRFNSPRKSQRRCFLTRKPTICTRSCLKMKKAVQIVFKSRPHPKLAVFHQLRFQSFYYLINFRFQIILKIFFFRLVSRFLELPSILALRLVVFFNRSKWDKLEWIRFLIILIQHLSTWRTVFLAFVRLTLQVHNLEFIKFWHLLLYIRV